MLIKINLRGNMTEPTKLLKNGSLDKTSDKEEKEDKEQSNEQKITSDEEYKKIKRNIMLTTRPTTKEIKMKRK